MFTEYVGVKNSRSRMPYFMIPASLSYLDSHENLDEELYTVDVDSLKRSKQAALKRMDYDLKMADSDGRETIQ